MFLDSDNPLPDAMNDMYWLDPRAVVHASAVDLVQDYRASYALGPEVAEARQVSMVTRALQEALGSDPIAIGLRQGGRMPGSRNSKVSLRPSPLDSMAHECPGAFADGARGSRRR